MPPPSRTRTFSCAYCAETYTVPFTRRSSPSYYAVAHRQAACRERRGVGRTTARVSRMTLHDQIHAIRIALEEAAAAKTWPEARRAFAGVAASLERQDGTR